MVKLCSILIILLSLVSCVQEIPLEDLESETFVEGDSSVIPPIPAPSPVVDTTAPKLLSSSPSGVQPSTTTSVVMQVVTDEKASCRFDEDNKIFTQMLNILPSSDGGITHLRSYDVVDGESYKFYVLCQDDSKNELSHELVFSVTKKGVADTMAPTITSVTPTGELAAGSTSVDITLTSSEASICKYSKSSSQNYDQMANLDTINGIAHTKKISPIIDGDKVYFLCKDIAGNSSGEKEVAYTIKKVEVPPVNLETSARDILKTNCLSCHGGSIGTFKGLDISKDEILFNKVSRFVVKGSPEESKIYLSLKGNQEISQMPPGKAIADTDQKVIYDWIAAMPKEGVPEEIVCDEDADIRASLTRRLTQKELEVSIYSLLNENIDLSGIRADQRNFYGITRDGSRLGISSIEVEEYILAIEKVVNGFVSKGNHSLFNCSNLSGTLLNSCLDQEFFPILYRSWRRPVTSAQRAQFRSFFSEKGFQEGLRFALNFTFLSPKFFLLTYDDGNENRVLNSFEIAERLALLIWTRVPSLDFLEVARTKNLADKDILLTEFKKLLDLDSSKSDAQNRNLDRDKGWNFFLELQNQWLKLDEIANLKYQRSGVGEHLRWATMFFIEEHFRENKTVQDMFTADFAVTTNITAELYGGSFSEAVENNYDVYNSPNRFKKLSIAGSARKGLLGQAGVLAMNSGSRLGGEVNPTYRGLWHAKNILCDLPDAIPSDIVLTEELKSNNVSLKEKFKIHTADPKCASCHTVMDPIGFGLWEYDELGLTREADKSGFPIAPEGELYGQFFNTSSELIDIIAQNKKVEACFMTHLATYSVGREVDSHKSCTTQKILKEVKKKNGGMLDMLEGIITSDLFLKRQKK